MNNLTANYFLTSGGIFLFFWATIVLSLLYFDDEVKYSNKKTKILFYSFIAIIGTVIAITALAITANRLIVLHILLNGLSNLPGIEGHLIIAGVLTFLAGLIALWGIDYKGSLARKLTALIATATIALSYPNLFFFIYFFILGIKSL